MVKDDLIKNSPVRALEKKTSGSLSAGEIGVIVSPTGIGKTSVLVQIALDKLLQDKKIIHISFNQHSDYILGWYQNIFDEIMKKRSKDEQKSLTDEIVRNRIVMNFNQDGVNSDVIRSSLKAMIVDGGYKAESIIIDAFDFSKAARERIATLRTFAKELGFSLWYTYSVKDFSDVDKNGVPATLKNFEDILEVIITMETKSNCTELSVIKNRDKFRPSDSVLKLDPKTLLILQ
ncbi:hypothetical protein FACS1894102_5000 [Spirochaetia bacterium]|nr:hypothetical protein FACS1894102_5000 [Spirochaetia bacterium]